MTRMRTLFCSLVAVVAMATAAAPADAAFFTLTYVYLSGDELTATIEGTVDPMNSDNVLVTAVTDGKLNSVPGVATPFVQSITDIFTGSGFPPVLTFSGANLDFFTGDAPSLSATDGFFFDGLGVFIGVPIFASGPTYGDTFEVYNPAGYSLVPQAAAVPEPASLALVGTALAGLAGFGRRKARRAA